MSENQNESSFAKDVAKATTVNAAASAGAVVGLFGGLMVIGTLIDKFGKKSTPETQESEKDD